VPGLPAVREDIHVRAAILPAFRSPYEIRDDVHVEGPAPGHVRVRLAGSGLCGSDVKLQDEGRQGARTPLLIGHEAAGVVADVGKGVEGLAEGDHVILSRVTSCGNCAECASGNSHLCRSLGAPGMAGAPPARWFGDHEALYGLALAAHAEETIVHARAAIKIDDDVPLDVAAVIGCSVTTGVGAALNTARVAPGSSVVVFGSGGVGLNVIQGARIAGASEIVAVDPVASRREDAVRFGATAAIGTDAAAEVLAEISHGRGFDYAFESIGRTDALSATIGAARRGGTAVIVGMGGEIRVPADRLALQELKILGSYYGSANVRVEFPRLIRLWRTGQLKLEELVTGRISLDGINEGYAALRAGEGIRTVVTFP
jgi:S-(hydroxymethyl)glutathione dehydrogenase / alcohol dehydrogenase